MKRLFLACLAALPLASCGPVNSSSNGLAGDPDDYYEIKYYSDYNGIDYSHPDPSLATYIGHAFVKKDAESRVAVLSEENKDFNYTVSTRTDVPEGRELIYDGFLGYYDDGTQIDLSNVTGSGMVFASFREEKIKYAVNFYSGAKLIYQTSLPYGTVIERKTVDGVNVLSFDDAGEAVELSFPAESSHYYETAEFSRFFGSNSTQDEFSLTFPYTISRATDIKAEFVTDLKEYEVSLSLSPDAPFGPELVFADSSSLTQSVTYDNPVDLQCFIDEGLLQEEVVYEDKIYSLVRMEGAYGEDAPSTLAGKPVDTNHIRYSCLVYLIYEVVPFEVNFVVPSADGATSSIVSRAVYSGEATTSPSVSDIGELTFSGYWFEAPEAFDGHYLTADAIDGLTPFDIAAVTSSATIYPYMVEKELIKSVPQAGETHAMEVHFAYDLAARGYDVSSIAYVPESTSLTKEDLSAPVDYPALTPTRGILTLSSPADSGLDRSYRNIVGIELPDTVVSLKAEALRELTGLTSLDISSSHVASIDFNCFKDCLNLVLVSLPLLSFLGNGAFYGCESLQTVTFALGQGKEAISDGFDQGAPEGVSWVNLPE